MTASEIPELEIVTKIPAELEQHRDALDASLFYLALGENPVDYIQSAECKSSRIKVRGKAITYLQDLTRRYGSQRRTIINALAWAAAQPEKRRALLKNTVI